MFLSFSIFGVFFFGGLFISSKVFNLSNDNRILFGLPLFKICIWKYLNNQYLKYISNKDTYDVEKPSSNVRANCSLILSLSFFHPFSFYLPVLLMTLNAGIIWPVIVKAVPSLSCSASGLVSAIMSLSSSLTAATKRFFIETYDSILFLSYFLMAIGSITLISTLLV